jgi:ssDNA-binding Zn-finger/Zn-ribbon topoisomerase 1
MYKKETKEVKEQRQVVVAVVCDNCGKEHKGSKMPDEWHSFSGHHDSIDSYENYMVCSPKCYKEKLKEAVNEFDGYDSAEIDEMTIQFAKNLVDFLNTP